MLSVLAIQRTLQLLSVMTLQLTAIAFNSFTLKYASKRSACHRLKPSWGHCPLHAVIGWVCRGMIIGGVKISLKISFLFYYFYFCNFFLCTNSCTMNAFEEKLSESSRHYLQKRLAFTKGRRKHWRPHRSCN